MTGRAASAVVAALLAVGAPGCVGGSRSGSDHPGVSDLGGPAAAPAGPAQKESLNRASEDDVAAALRRSNVDDPEGWAQILVRQRPYPPGAPGEDRIRQVLVEREADPEEQAKILDTVEP